MANLSSEWHPAPTGYLRVALLEQQKKQFKSVRHPEFFKDTKQVILDGVLAKPEAVSNLLVALALSGTLCHLELSM